MIRHYMGLSALVIVLGAPTLGAQRARAHSASPFSWSAGAGMSVPTGDLSNGASNGFHFQGAGSYHRLGLPIDLRADLAYHHFGEKDFTVPGARNQVINYTGKSSMIGGSLDASYALNTIGRMRPYLLAGPGVYNTRAEVTRAGTTTSTTSSDTKAGLNVGGGMNFSLMGRRAFLEARYHHVNQAAWIPITLGIRF